MRYLFPMVFIVLTSTAHAEIYKCVSGGKTVFSQQPCAPDAATVTPKYVQPSADSIAQRKDATEKMSATSKDIDREHRIMDIDLEMQRLDESERQTQNKRLLELRVLEEQGRYANNNLAGATWEQSLAMKMQAVNGRYDSELKIIESRRQALQGERDRLTKQTKAD